MLNSNPLEMLAFGIICSIIIFFITREFWIWYFKINSDSQQLKDIEN